MCFTQALENAESKYHANDLRLASIRLKLGAVNAEMKEWNLAMAHYGRGQEIRAAVLGNEHADTASIVRSMEMVQNALDEAELRKEGMQVPSPTMKTSPPDRRRRLQLRTTRRMMIAKLSRERK